jgi:hypothetical protein
MRSTLVSLRDSRIQDVMQVVPFETKLMRTDYAVPFRKGRLAR